MSEQQNPKTDFEQRLLAQLKEVVAERGAAEPGPEAAAPAAVTPAWRRGPRLALGGAVAIAAVATGLVVSAGGDNPPAAFAVEPQDGGGVTIKIYSLSDASGVEQALGEAGIPSQVTYLPAGTVCREPHYEPSMVKIPMPEGQIQPFGGFNFGSPDGPMTIGIGGEQKRREVMEKMERDELTPAEASELTSRYFKANLYLNPDWFSPDQTLILSGSPAPHDGDPTAGSVAQVRIAEGEVEPCEPAQAPEGSVPLRAPEGGWDFD